MKITIPGVPIAKARPRFVRVGKFVRTYDIQETEAGKWLLFAKNHITGMLTGPVRLKCEFIFPRPKGHYGTGRNSGKLKPSAPAEHTKKPDVSNLIKFPEDILNGIAWHDDSQIIRIEAKKRYVEEGEVPMTKLVIGRGF